MQLFRYLCLILLSSTLFLGCSAVQEPKQELKELPKWISNMPQDDKENLWGIGIAPTRQDAIHAALNEISSKLQISLESSYHTKQSLTKYTHDFEQQNTLKATLANITLNNYQVVQSTRLSYKEFAVLVNVQREKLIGGLIEDLQAKKEELQKEQAVLIQENPLQKLMHLATINRKQEQFRTQLKTLQALDEKFQAKGYINFLNILEKKSTDIKNAIDFYLQSKKNVESYAELVQIYLQKKKQKIAKKKTQGSILVSLDVVSTQENFQEIFFWVTDVTIRFYDSQGMLLKNKKLRLKSRQKDATKEFATHLEESSLEELFGVKEKRRL